jgi:acetate kinase
MMRSKAAKGDEGRSLAAAAAAGQRRDQALSLQAPLSSLPRRGVKRDPLLLAIHSLAAPDPLKHNQSARAHEEGLAKAQPPLPPPPREKPTMSPSSLVLVANAGSSSLKFKLFEASGGALTALAGGLLERIGDTANSAMTASAAASASGGGEGASASASASGGASKPTTVTVPIRDHVDGMKRVLDFLAERFPSLGSSTETAAGTTAATTTTKAGRGASPSAAAASASARLAAVGHRVVHGLDLTQACLVTPAIKAKIREAAKLAPLHNPAGLAGIEAAEAVFGGRGGVPQAAVFDTAFHAATLPPKEHVYPLPWELYASAEPRVRKYGFHGTSHKYLSLEAGRLLGLERPANLVTCHLGNGSSAAAIRRGSSVATTMGLTPLEGLMMGTRSGDLDPAVPLYLMSFLNKTAGEIDALLNKKSGLLGVCGASDVRAVLEGASNGDARCALALEMYAHRARKYVGAYYMGVLDGEVDAVVFSAGIGENSPVVREMVVGGLEKLGLALDREKNYAAVGSRAIGKGVDISAEGSRVKVLVVPTDEELMIAREALEVVEKEAGATGA